VIEAADILTDMQIVDSPTSAASDWDYTGLAFQPDFAAMILNRSTALDTTIDDERAGVFHSCSFDSEGNLITVGAASEDDQATTDTQSRASDATMYMPVDDGTASLDLDTIVFTADGFHVDAADIDTADGTARKIPTLFMSAASSAMMMVNMQEGIMNV
jgi:hypothetical protein